MVKSEKSLICVNVNKIQIINIFELFYISLLYRWGGGCCLSLSRFITVTYTRYKRIIACHAGINILSGIYTVSHPSSSSVSHLLVGWLVGREMCTGNGTTELNAAISFWTDNNNPTPVAAHNATPTPPPSRRWSSSGAIRSNGQINQSIGIWFMVWHQTGFDRHAVSAGNADDDMITTRKRWMAGVPSIY